MPRLLAFRRCVVTGRPGTTPAHGVHSSTEIGEPFRCDGDVALGNPAGPLLDRVEEQKEGRRPSVEDPIQRPTVVAAKLTQRPADLRAVREREWWRTRGEAVQQVDRQSERLVRVTEFDFAALSDLSGASGPLGPVWQVAGRAGLQPIIRADDRAAEATAATNPATRAEGR
jgi:hypothetical protein